MIFLASKVAIVAYMFLIMFDLIKDDRCSGAKDEKRPAMAERFLNKKVNYAVIVNGPALARAACNFL